MSEVGDLRGRLATPEELHDELGVAPGVDAVVDEAVRRLATALAEKAAAEAASVRDAARCNELGSRLAAAEAEVERLRVGTYTSAEYHDVLEMVSELRQRAEAAERDRDNYKDSAHTQMENFHAAREREDALKAKLAEAQQRAEAAERKLERLTNAADALNAVVCANCLDAPPTDGAEEK